MAGEQDDRTRTLLALTREIEDARRAITDEDTPAARARLQTAELAYRSFLVGLNGLASA